MPDTTPLQRRTLADEPALDWRSLFAQGLAHLRQLSGRRWTDHNLHDPGITVLELACHALTDLAYRSSLPLLDLLASSAGSAEAAEASTWSPAEMLPQAPWTADDLRRLLIDLPGVRNAWLLPVDSERLWVDPRSGQLARSPSGLPGERTVVLQGLLRGLLELDPGAERDATLALARRTLQSRRPLCLDVVDWAEVPVQHFALCAEVELSPEADPRESAARLLHAAARTLAPPLRPHSLGELLATAGPDGRPRELADLLQGPLPHNGFITDEDLAASALPDELHLSDLVHTLMALPGVRALRDIRLQPLDADGEPLSGDSAWRLPVAGGHAPRLALDSGRLVLLQRGLVVAGYGLAQMPEPVRLRLAALLDEDRLQADTARPLAWPAPAGRVRPLAEHRSLQLDLPELYGLRQASPDARVQQLQAYLLFIDQWFANHLAQLGQVAPLLSVAPARMAAIAEALLAGQPLPTLHAQRVRSVPGHEALYLDTAEQPLDDAGLTRLFEPDPRDRQARLLDHLLARAAEDLGEHVSVLQHAFGGGDAGGTDALLERTRCLAELPRLQAERGQAYQQHLATPQALWNSDNISGLERRIARLLGLVNPSRRSLSVVAHDTYAEVDATPGDEFRFRVRDAVSGQILLSSSTHYVSPEAARREMLQAIERAQGAEGYQRLLSRDGRHYFNIVDAGGEVIARRIAYFDSAEALEQAIVALRRYLREHYSGEGLYLIELPLLRPGPPEDPLLPICAEEGCGDCDGDDPYSWRLQIVLPAYAGRFANEAFRAHAEQVIRAEVPAHCLPRLCWIGPEAMAEFEAAYRDWLALHAGAGAPPRQQVLQRFVRALTEVRNVYPPQRLTDCLAELPRPAFVLGRSALGSADVPPDA